jgi:Glycosyl hydrolase family 59
MPASFLPPRASRASARTAAPGGRTTAVTARIAACTAVATLAAGVALFAATGVRPAHAQPPSATNITVNANARSSTAGANRVYDGVGGVLAGGANARYLMDYPDPERSQILDYLFKPGYGASLQMLKLEIGGGANSTDGSEPSIEPVQGQVNCNAGFEMSIAQRALARNPNIVLYGLQWTAPSWVDDGSGSVFTSKDIQYLLDWLGCAKRRGLPVRYLGGWNEDDDGTHGAWFASLRQALDVAGYSRVKLIAGDDFASTQTGPQPWEYASDPDIATLGAHDICGYPTGSAGASTTCKTTPAALRSGKPLWASELGGNAAGAGPGCPVACASAMTRSIVRGYPDAKMTGYLEWPAVDAMPAGLPYENAGLLTAGQPWSGNYTVNAQTWAIAHFTQFAAPGWHYLDAASGFLQRNRADGSYDTLVSPAGNQWSSVVETTAGVTSAQQANFTVTGGARGLGHKTVHVWASNFSSGGPSNWFVHQQDIKPSGGKFSLTVQPGYVYTLTTTSGQGKGTATGPGAASLRLPYSDKLSGPGQGAGYDNEPELLAAQNGSFELAPCRVHDGADTTCTQQNARPVPVMWRYCDGTTNAAAGTGCHYPYATVGDPGWTNYTVSSDVLFTRSRSSAGLIGRFSNRLYWQIGWFSGYVFDVSSSGAWKIIKNSGSSGPATLAKGELGQAPGYQSWHRLSMTLNGSSITVYVDGHPAGSVTDSSYTSGQAGVEAGAFTSEWPQVQYSNLAVNPAASAAPSGTPSPPPAGRTTPPAGDRATPRPPGLPAG